MKAWILFLSLVLMINGVDAQAKKKEKSGIEKVLKSMFSPKPKPTPKTHKIIHVTKAKGKPKFERMYVVKPEWIAKYWELEEAWDYEIPEDDHIEYENGFYKIPLVVFKHYQDMDNTPQRAYAQ